MREEQLFFPAYGTDIAEELTRPLPVYQDGITGKEMAVMPASPPEARVEIKPAPPTPFLGLSEERTPWPAVLRPGGPQEISTVPPGRPGGLPAEQTPFPPDLSARDETGPVPLGYVMEIAHRATRLLPAFRPSKQVSRRRLPILLACVSGLLVVVLVMISVLALRAPQPRRSSLATSVPSHSTAVGMQPTSIPPTTVPTPIPQAQPILPFPTTLPAQIAALEAHDRFFYNGNTNLPEIALTFDDGPSPAYTPQVLAILQRYHINATFFDVGRLVQVYPDLARQELRDGNDVGNHTWSHPDMPLLTVGEMRTQIQQTSDVIARTIGVRPIYMRPPYGAISARVLPVINDFGLTTVIWNDEARDWSLPGTSVIVARILNLARDGAIVLMHDGGGVRAQTVQALPTIIERLRARGYRFVTMDQLIAHLHQGKQNGTPTPTPSPGGTVTPAPEGIWCLPRMLEPWWPFSGREKRPGVHGHLQP